MHVHLQEEDRADDQDHQDAYIQALHLWILLTTYAIILDKFKNRKTQECPKEDWVTKKLLRFCYTCENDARIPEKFSSHGDSYKSRRNYVALSKEELSIFRLTDFELTLSFLT